MKQNLRLYRINHSFNSENETIDVYELKPNSQRIAQFREEQMKTIPSKKAFFRACTNQKNQKFFEQEEIYQKDLDRHHLGDFNDIYGNIFQNYESTIEESEIQKHYLEAFYWGIFDSNSIKKVIIGPNHFEHYLIIDNYREYPGEKFKYQMNYIMYIPSLLYQLHMLLQNNYSEINLTDIDMLLDLFDIKCIGKIKISELENMCNSGLVSDTINEIIQKAEKTSKILAKSTKY